MSNDHQAPEGEANNPDAGDKIASLFEVKEERAGLRRGIYLLPNSVTTGALFSGFYAIIAAFS